MLYEPPILRVQFVLKSYMLELDHMQEVGTSLDNPWDGWMDG